MKQKDIIVLFTAHGLTLDTQETSGKAYYNEVLCSGFQQNQHKALLYFGFEARHPDMSASLSFLHGFCKNFISAVSKDPNIEITKAVSLPEAAVFWEMLRCVPYAVGMEHVSVDWLTALWEKLCAAFAYEMNTWEGTVTSFLLANNAALRVAGRVFFHLVENPSAAYPFAFLATYATQENQKAVHTPLKNALLEYKGQQDLLLKLLSTVSRAADTSDFISELVESGELFSPLQFNADEAYTFLKEIPLYEESGILCRIPDWWRKKSTVPRLSISIGGNEPSQLGLEALLGCVPTLTLGGEEMTKDELEALLSQTSGLSFLKGKWIEVDHDKLRSVLEAYEKVTAMEDVTMAEALRMELGLVENTFLRELGDSVELSNGAWLAGLRSRLTEPAQFYAKTPGDAFKAQLRQYQQSGFCWLAAMQKLGFGALLADDMGLGKTVQILALLTYLKQNGGFRGLLVVPASLIGNWEKEIARFAPELHYAVLHANHTELADGADLVITTYGMALRLKELQAHTWDVLILDEAQAIKNPGTGQTRAVKQLRASFKIAMTGTPVENKLGDLWSIFDFLNVGLLGTSKEFSRYVASLKETGGSYAKLREVTRPFILRRLKTDKAIISDLPDKLECKTYTALTAKQIVLYQGLIKELARKLSDTQGIERKGAVLAAIMKFKQICNHPDQYLGQPGYKESASGKFETLREICATIYEKRERVLVFTQFKELTAPIAAFLSTVFARDGLVLHGSTTAKKRTELVEQFNGDAYVPFMVLSLKAGGVGLNLTAANHVIHFDRWWNPAVENQATDRAFRIGQTKNVMVHKFITTGTIEEKIDEMIEKKQKLSGDIVAASGESWITEMSNEELLTLVKLEV